MDTAARRARQGRVNQHGRRTSAATVPVAEEGRREAARNWVWSAERRIRQEKQLEATHGGGRGGEGTEERWD